MDVPPWADAPRATASMTPPTPLRPNLRDQWLLDPSLTFLNHGSFGSVPRVVFDAQTEWRRRIEADVPGPGRVSVRRRDGLETRLRGAVRIADDELAADAGGADADADRRVGSLDRAVRREHESDGRAVSAGRAGGAERDCDCKKCYMEE